jgi:hypothetical protein
MGSPPDRSVSHQFELQTGDICLTSLQSQTRKLGQWIHQEQKIGHFESYIAPVDCLTAPEMRLVAFSEKPLCLIDVLTATMLAPTIKGYRSAIARTIHLPGGPDFGSDAFLSATMLANGVSPGLDEASFP